MDGIEVGSEKERDRNTVGMVQDWSASASTNASICGLDKDDEEARERY